VEQNIYQQTDLGIVAIYYVGAEYSRLDETEMEFERRSCDGLFIRVQGEARRAVVAYECVLRISGVKSQSYKLGLLIFEKVL
jgi:hypothetical protein